MGKCVVHEKEYNNVGQYTQLAIIKNDCTIELPKGPKLAVMNLRSNECYGLLK